MPTIPIRWSDNTDELKRNLSQGLNQIEATRASAEKLVQAFQGGRLAESANKWAAAISQIGGVTKLTAAEQERANAVFDKYIEKQQALGRAVPEAVTALNDEIKAMMAAREAANETGNSTNSAAATFNTLKSAIQSPTEAAKTFSSEFGAGVLEPLGEFGMVAAAAVTVAGAVGVGLVELASHARETAAAIHDIYEVTGMSVPAVSNLKFAIESAGGSLEQINGALFQFEQRMENNSDKVDKGLKMIGLSLGQIRDMSADQRLLAISDALRNTGDDTNKAAVAMDIFGKQGRDMLPLLLKPLRDLTDEAKRLNLTMTTEDSAAAEEFALKLNTVKAQASATWTALGLHVSIADEFSYAYERMKLAIANVAYAFGSTVTAIVTLNQYLPAALQTLRGTVGDLPQVSGDAKKGIDALGSSVKGLQFKPVALEGEALTRTEKELEESAKALIKQEQEQQKEAAKLREFYANLSSSVEDLSGAQIEAIKYYQSQNVSVSDIAKALGIYQHQVELVVGAEKQAIESAKLLTEAKKKQAEAFAQSLKPMSEGVLANLKAQNVAQDELAKTLAAATETATQQQLDAVDKWERDEKAKLDTRAENYQQAEDAIVAAAQARRNEIARLSELEDVKVKWEFVGPEKAPFNALTATFAQNLQHSLSETAKGIPDTLVRALEGGGGLKGAAESIGSQLGGDLTSSLGKSLSKGIGGQLGNIVGGIIGPLGSLLGPLLGKLFNIGGPSKQELQGRDLESKFQQSFGGFDQMMQAVGKAYLATGKTLEQAQADVKALLDAEKQGPEATQKWIDKINQTIDTQKKLDELRISGTNDAATGLTTFLTTSTTAASKVADLQKQIADVQAQRATASGDQAKNLDAQLASLQKQLQTQQALQQMTGVNSDAQATAFAGALTSTFDQLQKNGVPITEAVKQVGPAVDALHDQLMRLGEGGGQAFDELYADVHLAEDEIGGPALNAVQGIGQALIGMRNNGRLTQDMFAGMASKVTEVRNGLIAQGKDGDAALRDMQPTLQTLWEMEQDFGYKVDDGTQALIDQAHQQGIVGEQMRSTEQQTLDVLKAIAKALGADIPDAARRGAAGVNDALDNIKDPTVTVHYRTDGQIPDGSASTGWNDFPQSGAPDLVPVAAATGGIIDSPGKLIPFARYMRTGGLVPEQADYFAAGRLVQFVPRGTDTVPAMLTPRELVVNEIQTGTIGHTLEQANSLAQLATSIFGASASGSDEVVAQLQAINDALMSGRNVSVQVDGETLVRAEQRVLDRSGQLRRQHQEILGISA